MTGGNMQKLPPLEFGCYYHIYHRGVNRQDIFFEERNYRYFLDLYVKHIEPVADTFAYCLMRNHIHLLVRIKMPVEQLREDKASPILNPKQHFSNFFNAYAKAINQAYGRTGSLFQNRFGRIPVTSDKYYAQLVTYIHRNPQKHGFVSDYREYPYSSYATMCCTKPTKIKRTMVLEWFGGNDQFLQTHQEIADGSTIANIVEEDSD
jgi:putative transposase